MFHVAPPGWHSVSCEEQTLVVNTVAGRDYSPYGILAERTGSLALTPSSTFTADPSGPLRPWYRKVSRGTFSRHLGVASDPMASAFFLFQFSPARIETINSLLGLLELGVSVPKIEVIAHDRRVFQSGTFGAQFLLG